MSEQQSTPTTATAATVTNNTAKAVQSTALKVTDTAVVNYAKAVRATALKGMEVDHELVNAYQTTRTLALTFSKSSSFGDVEKATYDQAIEEIKNERSGSNPHHAPGMSTLRLYPSQLKHAMDLGIDYAELSWGKLREAVKAAKAETPEAKAEAEKKAKAEKAEKEAIQAMLEDPRAALAPLVELFGFAVLTETIADMIEDAANATVEKIAANA